MKWGVVVMLRREVLMAGSINANSKINLEGMLWKFVKDGTEFLRDIKSYRYVCAYCMDV